VEATGINSANGKIITDEQWDKNLENYPLKRFGKPEDIAYAVIFLLSDASEWITGSDLLIDGGSQLLF
jgi:NAD(P)-dependent dehydrogenase (short-subunit alcohol dehydrogenase family)